MSRGPKASPPAYVAHRTVFMAIVIMLGLLVGFVVYLMSPGLVAFVEHTAEDLHRAWTDMNWELF